MRWGGALALAFAISLAGSSRAQSLTVAPVVTRKLPLRRQALHPNWVNLEDCRADDAFTFDVSASGPIDGLSLEVWAGTARCDDYGQREAGSTAQCWLAAPAQPVRASQSVVVRAPDLVARNLPTIGNPFPHADVSVCDLLGWSRQQVTLYVLLVDAAKQSKDMATFDTGWDLSPPEPPSAVTSGAGRERVHLTWTRSVSADVFSYRFYCEAIESDGCRNVEGGVPRAASPCGEVFGPDATSGFAAPLVADQFYRIVVASTDDVGNVGDPSSMLCETPAAALPAPASSSGCALSRGSAPSRPALSAFVGALLALALRRRRHRSIMSTSTPSAIR